MLDALGIVKPVKGQYDLKIAELLAQGPGFLLYALGLHTTANLPVVDAHRERVNPYCSFAVYDCLAKIVFDSKDAEYASEKVLCVVDCVESDQIGSNHAFQYIPAPSCREGAEHVIRREWGVQEETDGDVGHCFSQESWEKHEMVIVDPDSVVGPKHVHQRVSEDLVYPNVLGPVGLLKLGICGKVMEQRPDRAVTESVIESIHCLSI